MTPDITYQAIVDRIAADDILGICDLTREAVLLLLRAAELTEMPATWMEGAHAMDPGSIECVSILLHGVLKAVDAELNSTVRPLRVVRGGGA